MIFAPDWIPRTETLTLMNLPGGTSTFFFDIKDFIDATNYSKKEYCIYV